MILNKHINGFCDMPSLCFSTSAIHCAIYDATQIVTILM